MRSSASRGECARLRLVGQSTRIDENRTDRKTARWREGRNGAARRKGRIRREERRGDEREAVQNMKNMANEAERRAEEAWPGPACCPGVPTAG